jgi:hypothetical protein
MNQQNPIQEAMSLVTIVAILATIGCYAGGAHNAPFITPALEWIAEKIYEWMPSLSGLRYPQMPLLVASISVGIVIATLGIGCAGPIAMLFSQSQIAGIDRQTDKLKEMRAKLEKKRRDKGSFNVS